MAKVYKTLLRTGVYSAPQGNLKATPARLRGWAEKFRAMKDLGIKVPVAWGHQPQAKPLDRTADKASKQYYLSKFNAGYLEDLAFDSATGRLRFGADIPGCEVDPQGNLLTETTLDDGRKVKSAIGEVSAAVNDWRDGQGRLWKDCLIHVALTPLPVAAGESGFTSAPPEPSEIHLSLASILYELGGDTDMPAAILEPDVDDAEGGTEKKHFKKMIAGLEAKGIHLPEDTTPENVIERLMVALHAVTEGGLEDEPDLDLDEQPDEPSPIEEPRPGPMMMSLATAKTPREKKLLQREQQRHRGNLERRIARLVKYGLKPHRADALRGRLDGYELSLTAEGDLVEAPVDVELKIWEQAAEDFGGKKFAKRYLGTTPTEEPRPRMDGEDDTDMKKLAEERAARISH